MKKTALFALLLVSTGCGAGVPIQLRLDEFVISLSLDEALDEVSTQLLPPASPGLPEVWPDGFPDICYDTLVTTDPDEGGRVDLTPDPSQDPEAAQLFEAVNDGLVDRIEIDRLVVRVETNSLNLPLPPVEVQASDPIDASGEDRRAWRTVGVVGGTSLSPTCSAIADGAEDKTAVEPGDLADLEFNWLRGGESFFNSQLADEACLDNQEGAKDPLACKEFSLRARTRVTLDTAKNKQKPRGEVSLRLILIATFYVDPVT